MTDINPQHITVDQFFYGRLFRIPQYQRTYTWSTRQRRDLFNDIKRVHELGANRSHFMATVVGLRRNKQMIVATEHQIVEVVDGQQRITTLVILLNAIRKAADGSDNIEGKIKQEIRDSLIKDDDATLLLLQTNHDTSNYFADYLRTGHHPLPKNAQTIADREILSAMVDCERFVDEWRREGHSLVELVSLLKNRLTFILHEINDESLVYTVFEVLNSRGLAVSWFDRLKSMLMANIYESNADNIDELVNEVHQLWTDIYRCVGLRLGLSTESLRFAATLRHSDCPSRPLGEEDAALLLRERSKQGASQVIETTKWIKDVTEAADKLRRNRKIDAVTNIAQARMVATAVYLRHDLTDSQKGQVLLAWEKVTFRIYGIFGKDARWAVGDYVRLAWRIINNKLSTTQIISQLSEIGRDFPIADGIKVLQDADCYTNWADELRYFFHKYEQHLAQQAGQKFDNAQWDRIWESNVADSVEHIKPQSSFGSGGRSRGWGRMHRLGNLTLLPPGLNSSLKDKEPSQKADAYTKTGLLVTQKVALLLNPWTSAKTKQREDDLLEWASQEWGG